MSSSNRQWSSALSSIGERRVFRIVLGLRGRIDAAAVDADADRAVVIAGDADQVPHFFLPRLFALVVIEVARVVAELVDVRGDTFGKAVVLLQIDDEVGLGLPADFGDGIGFGIVVDGDANHVGAGGERAR